jgi:gluconolactonase
MIKRYIYLLLFIVFVVRCESQELFVSHPICMMNSFFSPEGPATDRNGNLYVVNYIKKGSIGVIKANDSIAQYMLLPNGSIGNGIRLSGNGFMFVADYVKHNIYKINMLTREISVLAHNEQWHQPNDIAIDSKNRLYASDPDWKKKRGKIWRIDPDGKQEMLDSSLGTVNGIEVNYDDTKLFVNETVEKNVWQYDLTKEGRVRNKSLLVHFDDFAVDGMRSDIKGNLFIARYGKGCVAKVSPHGDILKEIVLTGSNPTNIAFGGRDGCSVYVTVKDNGNVERFRTDIPGTEWVKVRK